MAAQTTVCFAVSLSASDGRRYDSQSVHTPNNQVDDAGPSYHQDGEGHCGNQQYYTPGIDQGLAV